MTMSEFAEELGEILGRPVVDATHLSGGYDFKLVWSPMDDSARAEAKGFGMKDADIDNLPSIFTAVREQLGLRLQSAKVPSKVIVVDNIIASLPRTEALVAAQTRGTMERSTVQT